MIWKCEYENILISNLSDFKISTVTYIGKLIKQIFTYESVQ